MKKKYLNKIARATLLILSMALFVTTGAPVTAQSSGPKRSEHVQATLIAGRSGIEPGKSLQLGLLLRHDRKWHTYWINPGDAGLATRIDWTLPAGFRAEAFQWPTPELISAPPLMSFGYGGETLLPVKIQVPGNAAPGTTIRIKAHAKWLECADICIPGQARFTLDLPVQAKTTPSRAWAGKFAATNRKLPTRRTVTRTEARIDAKNIKLTFEVPAVADAKSSPRINPPKAFFVPHQAELVSYAETQKITRTAGGISILMKRDPNGEKIPKKISGVLLTGTSGAAGLELHAKLKQVSSVAAANSSGGTFASSSSGGPTLLTALFFSLVGGLILNLMPCVLPVLSLKIVSFVNKSNESRGRVLAHGGMYSLGVLVSFWVLASVMLALRAGGTHLGWGFQLQSPLFVSGLAAFIFLFALNQLGVFELGTSLTRFGGVGSDTNSASSSGASGSFMAGILAVVVATPCTAPFMGSALGFAMARPVIEALLIFTFLGIGLALPYLLLSAFPGLLRFLPKPGAWMESLKHFMGFLLLATVVWLLWVLGRLAGVDVLGAILGVLVLIGVGAWILGRWTAPTRGPGVRLGARIAAMAVLIASSFLAYKAIESIPRPSEPAAKSADWEKFSPGRVAQLRKQGTPVFIDFTADWCLSCKANKAVALNAQSVKLKFRELGIVTMQADWTKRDDVITRTLREFGRSGVPLYVLYGRNPTANAVVLPELLTADIVLKALKKVGPARAAADVK